MKAFIRKLFARPTPTISTRRGGRTRLGMEALDNRDLMSVTSVLGADGVLNITGDSLNNYVMLYTTATQVEVYSSDISSQQTTRYDIAKVTRIAFSGGAGNDTFDNYTSVATRADGGAGDDFLSSGGGNDILIGGTGNDTYQFSIDYQLGTDEIRETFTGDTDTLKFLGWHSVNVNLNNVNLTDRADGKVSDNLRMSLPEGWLENIYTGTGNDTIVGTNWHNILDSGDGNDTIYGRGGNDSIYGGAGNDRLYGEDGNDVLIAGDGNDTMYGSAGNDLYYGQAGRDLAWRNGYRVPFVDANAAEGDFTVGLLATGTRFTPAELGATGDMTVSRNGNRLEFAGPSGAGFALRSNWGQGGNSFKATGPVTLETYYGDITLTSLTGTNAVVDMTGAVDGLAGFYKGISWYGVPVTGTTNPLNGLLDQATGGIGLDVNLPGVSWGIGLGSKVKSLDADAPVNAAVPYFYANVNTGYSLSYSTASVTAPNTYTGTFAIAPGDGTVYAAVTGLPVVSDLGIAVSPSGSIPYTPDRIPNGLANPNIFGHYYVRGALDLADASIPATIKGDLVLDLDANNDGTMLGLTGANVKQGVSKFLSGLVNPDELRSGANTVMGDMAVGFNGGVDLSLSELSLNLGSASAWYKPGQVGFRAATSNPFEDFPVLERLGTGAGTFDVQGYTTWTPGSSASPNWYFRADAGQSSMGGLTVGSLYLEAGNTIYAGGAIKVGGKIDGLLGKSQIDLHGTIGFNGSVSLTGSASVGASISTDTFDAGASLTATLYIGWNNANSTFTFGGSVYGSTWVDVAGTSVGASFSAYGTVTITSSGSVNFAASGSISGWVDPPLFPEYSFTNSFSLTNHSLTLIMPSGVPDLTFDW